MNKPVKELTIGQILPWAVTFLKYTDDVVNSIPTNDAELDWRPTDAAGGWYLSIREQAMHIADTRLEMLSTINGESVEGSLFLIEYGGTAKPWSFKPASRAEIIARLQLSRTAIDSLLAMPADELIQTSDSLIQQHEKMLEQLRQAGQDTQAREERGPGRIANVLLFLVAHEQSHRSVLQSLLRQRGHAVARYA